MALDARDRPRDEDPLGAPTTPDAIRRQMASFWGYGPASVDGLADIARSVRAAGLSPAQLGALYASVPRTGGTIGRRCDALRELLAGLEKEMR